MVSRSTLAGVIVILVVGVGAATLGFGTGKQTEADISQREGNHSIPTFFTPKDVTIQGQVTGSDKSPIAGAEVTCISSLFYPDEHWVVRNAVQVSDAQGHYHCQIQVDRRTRMLYAVAQTTDGRWCHDFFPMPFDKIYGQWPNSTLYATDQKVIIDRMDDPIVVAQDSPPNVGRINGHLSDDMVTTLTNLSKDSATIALEEVWGLKNQTETKQANVTPDNPTFQFSSLPFGFYSLHPPLSGRKITTHDDDRSYQSFQPSKSDIVFIDTSDDSDKKALAATDLNLGFHDYVK